MTPLTLSILALVAAPLSPSPLTAPPSPSNQDRVEDSRADGRALISVGAVATGLGLGLLSGAVVLGRRAAVSHGDEAVIPPLLMFPAGSLLTVVGACTVISGIGLATTPPGTGDTSFQGLVWGGRW